MDAATPSAEPGGQTLSSTIASSLRESIASGRIPPGAKLRLEELRTRFGVSLSPLREALSRLAAEGFVVLEDQRGYKVAPVSVAHLEEVTKLRTLVEGFALREAIAAGDDRWESGIVSRLYRLNKLGQAGSSEADVQAWESAHRDLHHHMIAACGMPLLMQFSATLHDLSDRYRRIYLDERPLDPDVVREHTEICDAVLERDADTAVERLRKHIERTGNNARGALASDAARPRRRAKPAGPAG
ncbi:GntR family transcriptional regulator [Ramlibacter sp.]|uniref:GntR family transcriptional regulator n=1 Tax=Ramlibacter sp. TaxID=1917967 RepID=UPI003D0B5685